MSQRVANTAIACWPMTAVFPTMYPRHGTMNSIGYCSMDSVWHAILMCRSMFTICSGRCFFAFPNPYSSYTSLSDHH